MKIADIRATPVSVPLVAPLRHANGCHWGRFVRTIVEVETDDGRVGLGELGGGGEAATAAVLGLKPYLVGRDPARLEEMRFVIANPTASLYNQRTQLLAALEFACLDLLGQEWGVPVSDILGGRLRDHVPLATNTVVVGFEQLAANVLQTAVDVILLDTTFWGGIRPCVKAAGICEAFQFGVAVHSSGELGIQLATMLHLGAVIPNLTFAADAHYHHLLDDIVEGGKLQYCHGAIPVPTAPGLGVKLDRDRLAQYHESFLRLGPYPYDQDPLRPGWAPLIPNTRWADPADARVPHVPA